MPFHCLYSAVWQPVHADEPTKGPVVSAFELGGMVTAAAAEIIGFADWTIACTASWSDTPSPRPSACS